MNNYDKSGLKLTNHMIISYLRMACESFEEEGDCETLLYALNNAMRAVCRFEAAHDEFSVASPI